MLRQSIFLGHHRTSLYSPLFFNTLLIGRTIIQRGTASNQGIEVFRTSPLPFCYGAARVSM